MKLVDILILIDYWEDKRDSYFRLVDELKDKELILEFRAKAIEISTCINELKEAIINKI